MHNLKIKNNMTRISKAISIGLLVMSVAVAAHVAHRRWVYERATATVEMVVSVRDMTQLGRLAGQSLPMVLEQIRKANVLTSVAVEEDSIQDLVADGRAMVATGADVLRLIRFGGGGASILSQLAQLSPIIPERTYVVFENRADFERTLCILGAEMGPAVQVFPTILTLSVIGDAKDLSELGIGFSPERLALVESYGFGVIPRFRNSVRLNQAVVKEKFATLPKTLSVATIIFEGTTVLGYPFELDTVASELADRQYRFGVIEFADQLGVAGLGRRLPNQIIRVHSFSEAEIENLPTDMVIHRYVRSARERNVKVVFLKPYFALGHHSLGNELVTANIRYFSGVLDGLAADGVQIGVIRPEMTPVLRGVTQWEWMAIGLGVIVSGWIVCVAFGVISGGLLGLLGLLGIGVAVMAVALRVDQGVGVRQLLALIAAIVMPTLSMVLLDRMPTVKSPWKRYWWGVGFVVAGCAITMFGALTVVGLLADDGFLLGATHFLGVKVAFVLPLLLTVYYYYLRKRRWTDLEATMRQILDTPVRYSALIIAGIGTTFLALYIIRSGNYLTVDTASSEHTVRQWLETIFSV
ncbi:hypothetical protein EBR57_06650, partial [bacterium]|nr:hypothetical protein [bacterium]